MNGGRHEHEYSALHFAALAGKPLVCRVLLEAGARTDVVNSVRRTAAQMAAFVGHSNCVAVINNFVPKEDVYYYTRRQPLEKEAKLAPQLARHIHDLVMGVSWCNLQSDRASFENGKTRTDSGQTMCGELFRRLW